MNSLVNKNIVENKSDPIWFKDMQILVRGDRLSEFFPNEEMTTIEKLNAIMRMTLYIGVLMAVLCRNYLYLYIPIITAGITYAIYTVQGDKKEMYANSLGDVKVEEEPEPCIKPTVDNPFMNYNKITSDRDRKPACISYDNPELKKDIEDKFNVNLYRDVSDLYGKRNSQREFYTTAGSTSDFGIGDQTAFSRWLYQSPPTCKEEGIQCTGNYTPQLYTQTPIVNR